MKKFVKKCKANTKKIEKIFKRFSDDHLSLFVDYFTQFFFSLK